MGTEPLHPQTAGQTQCWGLGPGGRLAVSWVGLTMVGRGWSAAFPALQHRTRGGFLLPSPSGLKPLGVQVAIGCLAGHVGVTCCKLEAAKGLRAPAVGARPLRSPC